MPAMADATAPAPPDPFALAELARDIRPPDYAAVFVRMALLGSALDQPARRRHRQPARRGCGRRRRARACSSCPSPRRWRPTRKPEIGGFPTGPALTSGGRMPITSWVPGWVPCCDVRRHPASCPAPAPRATGALAHPRLAAGRARAGRRLDRSTRHAVHAEHDASEQEDHERLARLARRQAELLASAVREDVAMLQATAAFQALNGNHLAGFEAFTERLPLEEYPGLSYVSYVVPIAPAQVPSLEAARRADGQPEFTVDPGPLDRRYHVVLFAGPNPGPTAGVDLGQIGMLDARARPRRRPGQGRGHRAVRPGPGPRPPAGRAAAVGRAVRAGVRSRRADSDGAATSRRAARLGDVVDPGAGPARRARVRRRRRSGCRCATPTPRPTTWPPSPPPPAPDDADRVVVAIDLLGETWNVEAATLAVVPAGHGLLLRRRHRRRAGVGGRRPLRAQPRLSSADGSRSSTQAALAKAAATERRFRAVFDNAPVGVVVVGLDGHVLDVNHAMAEMIDHTLERPLSLADCLLAEDVPAWTSDLARFRAGELQHIVVQRQLRRADGTTFWARTTSAPLRGERGHRGPRAGRDRRARRRRGGRGAALARGPASRRSCATRPTSSPSSVRTAASSTPARPSAALVGVTPEAALGSDAVEAVHPDDYAARRSTPWRSR